MKVLIFLLFFLTPIASAVDCKNELTLSPTDSLVIYLDQLGDAGLIEKVHLERFRDGCDRGVVLNPISEGEAALASALAVHREGIQEYLEKHDLDRTQLKGWAIRRIQESTQVEGQRKLVTESTRYPFQQMIFHRVPPGTFTMSQQDNTLSAIFKRVEVTVTKPFELMSTPVTQWQWSMIARTNMSTFARGSDSIKIGSIEMQPDHPVEQITQALAEEFLKKLNAMSNRGDALLAALIPDFRRGDHFRLPTEAELSSIVNRKGDSDANVFGRYYERLPEYAWLSDNARGQTHAVGQLKPLILDGKEFFDLHGSVGERVQDHYDYDLYGGKIPKLVDPVFQKFFMNKHTYHVHGGSILDAAYDFTFKNGRKSDDFISMGRAYNGLRLVRERDYHGAFLVRTFRSLKLMRERVK